MRSLYVAALILGFSGVSSVARAADRDGNPGIPGDVTATLPAPSAATDSAARTFTDRDLFLAAITGKETENVEREPWTAECDGGGLPSVQFFDFEVTAEPAALKVLRDACFGNHNTTPGGKRYLGADTDSADVSAVVTFHFERNLHAFGAWIIDLDVAGLEVEVAGETYEVPATGEGGEAFFGVLTAAPFQEVTCRIAGGGVDSHYSFDDIVSGSGGQSPVAAAEGATFSPWGRVKSAFR